MDPAFMDPPLGNSSPNFIREMEAYRKTVDKVADELTQKYDVMLIVGGSGPIVDLANNQRVHDLILAFRRKDKPTRSSAARASRTGAMTRSGAFPRSSCHRASWPTGSVTPRT